MISCFFTGCKAKPNESLVDLLDEIQKISSGDISLSVNIQADKAIIEDVVNNVDMEDLDAVDTEVFNKFLNPKGDLDFSVKVAGGFNKTKEEADIDVIILDKPFNLLVYGQAVYLDIDGAFEIIKDLIGSDAYFVRALLGDYKYIKLSTDSIKDEVNIDVEPAKGIDIKSYINEDNVTKDKNTYIAKLGSAFIKDIIKDTADLEAYGIKDREFKNSFANLSVLKDSNDTYHVNLSLNIENKISLNVQCEMSKSSFSVILPDKKTILDLNNPSEDSIFNSFDNEYDDDQDYEDLDSDWHWADDEDSEEYDEDDWEWGDFDEDISQYIVEIDYEPKVNRNAALSFVYSQTFEEDMESHLNEYYDRTISTLKNSLGINSLESHKYIDDGLDSYFANIEYDYEDVNTEYSILLSTGMSRLSVSYTFDTLRSSTADYIIYNLKSVFGIEMTEEELISLYNNLNDMDTKNDYRNICGYFDEGGFDFYRWDGWDGEYELEFRLYA